MKNANSGNVPAAMPLTMSTLEISGLTGKAHKNVLADVRKMFEALSSSPAEFSARYLDAQGKPREFMNLPKRECLILVSGYSVEMRARIIDRWLQLEAAVAGGSIPDILDTEARKAIGGIVKNVVHAQLVTILPEMVKSQIAESQFSIGQGWTAGEVVGVSGVEGAEKTKGMACFISRRLDNFHKTKGIPVRLGRLGMRSAYLFDPKTCREWLDNGGRSEITKRVAERKGQGVLKLVPKKPRESAQPPA